ncbi:MAG: hypothetical protein ACM3TN_27250, partial [Alphaproteobacteria bacterium]
MAGESSAPTISLRERSFSASGSQEKLSKWVVFSLILHAALITALFIMPFLPSRKRPEAPVYTVDLVGGEKIGATNFGTELPAPVKTAPPKEKAQPEPAAPPKETKAEPKKEKAEKKEIPEKTKAAEKIVIPEKKPVAT